MPGKRLLFPGWGSFFRKSTPLTWEFFGNSHSRMRTGRNGNWALIKVNCGTETEPTVVIHSRDQLLPLGDFWTALFFNPPAVSKVMETLAGHFLRKLKHLRQGKIVKARTEGRGFQNAAYVIYLFQVELQYYVLVCIARVLFTSNGTLLQFVEDQSGSGRLRLRYLHWLVAVCASAQRVQSVICNWGSTFPETSDGDWKKEIEGIINPDLRRASAINNV